MTMMYPSVRRTDLEDLGREDRRPDASDRRAWRRLRPTAEELEGRTLLSIGLDPNWGFGGVSSLNVPPDTATDTYLEIFDSIALQNGQVVQVGTLTDTPTASGSVSTTNVIVSRLTTAGFLDPSFGSGGIETIPTTFGGGTVSVQSAADIAVKADGSIDVLATVRPSGSSSSDFLVVQLTPNGSIDTTFGSSGFELIGFGPSSSPDNTTASALAIGPDGKVVAVGTTTTPGGTFFAVARLNTDGTLDTSFDATGTATVDFNLVGSSGEYDQANAVVVQPDGSIVVAGTAYLPSNGKTFAIASPADVAVARLTAGGTLDTSFNGTGMVTFNDDLGGSASSDSASVVILQGTQIVIAGSSDEVFPTTSGFVPSVYDTIVSRLNADGSFDTTFNGTGKFLLSFNQAGTTFNSSASSILGLADGSLLVGGYASEQNGEGGPSGGLLLSLTSTGGLDTSFSANGEALLPEPVESRMLMQTDGELIFRAFNNSLARTTSTTQVTPVALQVSSATLIVTGTGRRARATGLTITFNTGVNPTLAANVSSYVVRPIKGRRAVRIKKGGVAYNAASRTLTITFAVRNPVGKGFEVDITPGGIVGEDAQTLADNTILVYSPIA